jgi:hypothetical protein
LRSMPQKGATRSRKLTIIIKIVDKSDVEDSSISNSHDWPSGNKIFHLIKQMTMSASI